MRNIVDVDFGRHLWHKATFVGILPCNNLQPNTLILDIIQILHKFLTTAIKFVLS